MNSSVSIMPVLETKPLIGIIEYSPVDISIVPDSENQPKLSLMLYS